MNQGIAGTLKKDLRYTLLQGEDMSTASQRAKWRRQNKKRKEYFKEYYSSERGDKNRERAFISALIKSESGLQKKQLAKAKEKRKKSIGNRHIVVDGIDLWNETYAMNNMINNLNPSTYTKYRKLGIIPKAIYVKNMGGGVTWNFLSRRQITMINKLWHTKKGKRRPLKERCEYLYANWTKGEMGFGSEGNN